MAKLRLFLLAFVVCSMLGGCASSDKDKDEHVAVEHLYNRGHTQLAKTKYKKAAETFERVELEYPYSRWATDAKLMGAYAYYKNESYDDAIMALDRFIRFHPGNKNIPYAYYLKAICYFDQVSDVNRDQGETAHALDALQQVILRFPYSEYAADARGKIVYARGNLAGQEMEIGRYYLNRHNYLSALNRFSNVVNTYPDTDYVEEALYREVEVYTILGLPQEAMTAHKALKRGYPDGKWTEKAAEIIKG